MTPQKQYEKGFILSRGSREAQSIMVEEAWGQEEGAHWSGKSTVRKQKMNRKGGRVKKPQGELLG